MWWVVIKGLIFKNVFEGLLATGMVYITTALVSGVCLQNLQ